MHFNHKCIDFDVKDGKQVLFIENNGLIKEIEYSLVIVADG